MTTSDIETPIATNVEQYQSLEGVKRIPVKEDSIRSVDMRWSTINQFHPHPHSHHLNHWMQRSYSKAQNVACVDYTDISLLS